MITDNAFAPRRSSRRNSSTRALETRASAESTPAMRPPIGTRQMATISAAMSAPFIYDRPDRSSPAARGVPTLAAAPRAGGADGAAFRDARPLLDQPRL